MLPGRDPLLYIGPDIETLSELRFDENDLHKVLMHEKYIGESAVAVAEEPLAVQAVAKGFLRGRTGKPLKHQPVGEESSSNSTWRSLIQKDWVYFKETRGQAH